MPAPRAAPMPAPRTGPLPSRSQPAAGPAATMLPPSPRYYDRIERAAAAAGRRPVRYVCWPWPRPSAGRDPRAGPGLGHSHSAMNYWQKRR
jgi:hypothetical protein